jgi:hypothetical protein
MVTIFHRGAPSSKPTLKIDTTIQYCDDHPWFNMNIGNREGWFCPFDGKRMKEKTMSEDGLIGWNRGRLEYLSQFGVTAKTETAYLNEYYEANKRLNMLTGEPLQPKKVETQ